MAQDDQIRRLVSAALQHRLEQSNRPVIDAEAVNACFNFLHDHRMLVEPACGASLAAICDPIPALKEKENILAIVCGGAGITYEQLAGYRDSL